MFWNNIQYKDITENEDSAQVFTRPPCSIQADTASEYKKTTTVNSNTPRQIYLLLAPYRLNNLLFKHP